MADKALISEYTWRSLDEQRAVHGTMPIFIAPHDVPSLLRPTSRDTGDIIHVSSLACIANKEKAFREFVILAKSRRATIMSHEGEVISPAAFSLSDAVKLWKRARSRGVAVIGGKISAANRERDSKAKADRIRDRWFLPSKDHRTPALLDEVGLSYNTAIKFLGKRPIAQHNYQVALKRAERRRA